MSYLVFARKWRPQNFDELVGQDHITVTLKNAINLNRVSHAYLFAGPRGVGKTSMARILAKALNCQNGPTPNPCGKCPNCLDTATANSLDVIEIDGASNRGIDEIRNLREGVKLSPAHARFKIYIIDEVHQITEPAFNALLKTLEEPPPHVKFIFATTQPYKIPATILSRCQRFDFRRLSIRDIVTKLKEIARAEKINVQESVLFEVAKAADGSMRDAESILDQLNSFCDDKIELADVIKVLGIIEDELVLNLAELILKKDVVSILKMIDDLTNEGRDLTQFLIRFIEHIRDLSVLKLNKDLKTSLAFSDEMLNTLLSQSERFSLEDLLYIYYLLSNTYEGSKKTGLLRFSFEFALIKIVKRQDFIPIDKLLKQVNELDKKHVIASSANGGTKQSHDSSEKVTLVPIVPSSNNIDVNSAWPQLIRNLQQKKASLASFLAEGEPAVLESGILTVNFPKIHKFHKEILEKPENKRIVEGVCKDVFGMATKVEFHLAENFQRKNNFKFDEGQEEKKEEEDPILKDALDVFNGSVIKNNKRFNYDG